MGGSRFGAHSNTDHAVVIDVRAVHGRLAAALGRGGGQRREQGDDLEHREERVSQVRGEVIG